MADKSKRIDEKVLTEVKDLLWGSDLKDEVFSRWTQGFVFSEHESTALVQFEGGPCAVIAPVQGFIIKNLYFNTDTKDTASGLTEESTELLSLALSDILVDVSPTETFSIVTLDDSPAEDAPVSANNQENLDVGESSCKRSRLDQDLFHSQLRCTQCCDVHTMRETIKANLPHFQESSGVLLYLYSIILTKGIEHIKNEVEDPGLALIDGIHGHGCQSLINLLITGKAVSNVWDNDKEVCGLKLIGIPARSKIGFLTLMEHLRYCEVGWYLKNPYYPIWLIGSETHLTVLFSKEKNLVITESYEAAARRIFQRFDPEGNGFISTPLLGDLLAALDLFADDAYVDIMKSKLDAENLGIITLTSFMEEFFPDEAVQEVPKTFFLYHYNGLTRSCPENKVKYLQGKGVIQDELEVQIITDTSPMKMVLLTKWPTIELTWTNNCIPSLN